jgi:predicted RNA-binding protein (virulence factor B family)
MVTIGKRHVLVAVQDSASGMYLDGMEQGRILLPNRYVPKSAAIGDRFDVFVYRDSEDRLVATTEIPRAMVGESATLKVVSVNRQVGAFLDWGLPKDLLLPFREQTAPVRAGQEVTVKVMLDPKSQRIVASMKMDDAAQAETANYRGGQAVDLVITEKTELGYKALVDGRHVGLLYHDRLARPVAIGQSLKGFVRMQRPDGKIDLSLTEAGYRRVAPVADKIVQALQRNGGRLGLDDDSAPESIRQQFGVSKKSFKQALGQLYKARRIAFTKPGIQLLDNSNWSPEPKPDQATGKPAKPSGR